MHSLTTIQHSSSVLNCDPQETRPTDPSKMLFFDRICLNGHRLAGITHNRVTTKNFLFKNIRYSKLMIISQSYVSARHKFAVKKFQFPTNNEFSSLW